MDDVASNQKPLLRLIDEELAEILLRRPGVRVSLACVNMYLSAEEELLLEQMDSERLGPEERPARITELCREKRRLKGFLST